MPASRWVVKQFRGPYQSAASVATPIRGRYYYRNAPLLPLFRRECDHRIPCLYVAGARGVWGTGEPIGTSLFVGIFVSLDCRLCKPFQAESRRKTGFDRLPDDLVFLRTGNREIRPTKGRETEFRSTKPVADRTSPRREGTGSQRDLR